MNALPKRLIEVDLPIKRISEQARREKYLSTITSLHLWWARRPLAACRAVLCAALWPDPADPASPEEFRSVAKKTMQKWSRDHLRLLGAESLERFIAIRDNPHVLDDGKQLRNALLDFIADFSNWDNSNSEEFLESLFNSDNRRRLFLTQAAMTVNKQ